MWHYGTREGSSDMTFKGLLGMEYLWKLWISIEKVGPVRNSSSTFKYFQFLAINILSPLIPISNLITIIHPFAVIYNPHLMDVAEEKNIINPSKSHQTRHFHKLLRINSYTRFPPQRSRVSPEITAQSNSVGFLILFSVTVIKLLLPKDCSVNSKCSYHHHHHPAFEWEMLGSFPTQPTTALLPKK